MNHTRKEPVPRLQDYQTAVRWNIPPSVAADIYEVHRQLVTIERILKELNKLNPLYATCVVNDMREEVEDRLDQSILTLEKYIALASLRY